MAHNLKEQFTLFKHMPTLLAIICKSFSQEEKEIKQRLKYERGRHSRILRSEKNDIKALIQRKRAGHDTLNLSSMEVTDADV